MLRRLVISAVLVSLLAPAGAVARDGDQIVGGRPATRDYTHMAALLYESQNPDDFICGASLVRPDWILTAAHCVDPNDPIEKYAFLLGRQRRNDSSRGEIIPAVEMIQHPSYNNPGSSHDVALLRLERPSVQRPIHIAGPGEEILWAPEKTAIVTGWGQDNFVVGRTSDELREVEVPMVDDEDCETAYRDSFHQPTMVCAGEDEGFKDSCQGDSGGPLMVLNEAGELVLAGVVSWGLGCGFPVFYGVYSRVGDRVLGDWLREKLPPEPAPPHAPGTGGPSQQAPAAGAPGGGAGSPTAGSPQGATGVRSRLRLRVALARRSARAANRSRRVRLRLTSSGPVSAVRVTVTRRVRGRQVVVARGRLRRLTRRAALKLRVTGRLARGAIRVDLVASGPGGARLKHRQSLRLRR